MSTKDLSRSLPRNSFWDKNPRLEEEAQLLWAWANPQSEGPKLPEALALALKKEELRLAVRRKEHMSVFRRSGEKVFGEATNDASSWVKVPSAVPYRELRGGYLTHNHPGYGGCLSEADLKTATDLNLAEVRAVTEEEDGFYVYRALRPKKGWNRDILKKRELEWTSESPYARLNERLRVLEKHGHVKRQLARVIRHHGLIMMLTQAFGIPYYKEPLARVKLERGGRP